MGVMDGWWKDGRKSVMKKEPQKERSLWVSDRDNLNERAAGNMETERENKAMED